MTTLTEGLTQSLRNNGLIGCYTLSEETRRKISEANKGRIAWNKGKHLSENHRTKISVANMGRTSPSRKGSLNGMWGKKHTEVTKQKISALLKWIWNKERNYN